mgnify:CR=1 FL=1
MKNVTFFKLFCILEIEDLLVEREQVKLKKAHGEDLFVGRE